MVSNKFTRRVDDAQQPKLCPVLRALAQQREGVDFVAALMAALDEVDPAYQARRAESEARRREEARNIPF